MLTANRGLCGGYNGNVQRAGFHRWLELKQSIPNCKLEVVGQARHRRLQVPRHHARCRLTRTSKTSRRFDEVDVLANRYLDDYIAGKLDRLDVVYTKFESIARQQVVVETLLPLGTLATHGRAGSRRRSDSAERPQRDYEFLPSAESILEEVVPASFKVKLFKCFLDCGRQRADRPHGGHEGGHRERRRYDQAA